MTLERCPVSSTWQVKSKVPGRSYQVPGAVLTCSNKNATAGMVAATRITSKSTFMIIHSNLPRSPHFLHGSDIWPVKWAYDRNHDLYIFQDFLMLISEILPLPSTNPSKNVILVFLPSLRKRETVLALTSQVRELVWWFCQLLSISMPITHLETKVTSQSRAEYSPGESLPSFEAQQYHLLALWRWQRRSLTKPSFLHLKIRII